jgi:hypothetical protein
MSTTRDRVPAHTSERINDRIERETMERLRSFVGNPSQIPTRLKKLNAEWDIERGIEANASTLHSLASRSDTLFIHTGLSCRPSSPRFCFNMLRRLGFRIDRERFALKAVRRDFDFHNPPIKPLPRWRPLGFRADQ